MERIEVSGVLFDLDGTLLDIDIDRFLGVYLGELSSFVAGITGGSVGAEAVQLAVLSGTKAMMEVHEGTNRDIFNARVFERIGVNLDEAAFVEALDYFYGEVFPTLRGNMGPIPGAREAVEAALDLGLSVAVATHPVFPRAAIEERMRWAGVGDLPFGAITTYEVMGATKPHASYFRDTAAMLGLAPDGCIMVGDDLQLDLPARLTGMRVFHHDPSSAGEAGDRADWSGSMSDLAELLRTLG